MKPLHQILRLFLALAIASSSSAFQRPPGGRAARDPRAPQEAFLELMRELQSQPPSAPSSDITRLRREIIELVRGMEAPPPVPAEARRRLDNAMAFDEARALLGPTAPGAEAGEAELQAALAFAPWWPEALLKLSQNQSSLGRLAEAEETMNLYRLANAPATVRGPQTPLGSQAAAQTRPAVTPAASSGSGTIMIYWPKQFKGAGRPKIQCDGARVGDLGKGRYITISAEAGLHSVKFINDTAGVRVLPGVISYLRVAAVGFPARAEAREVPAAEAEAEMLEKAADLNEPEKTYSTVCGVGKK